MTSSLLRLIATVLFILGCLCSGSVLAQDETSSEPELTQTEGPPEATSIATASSGSPVITTDLSLPPPRPTFTITTTPLPTSADCPDYCRLKAVVDNGCVNPKNSTCVCPQYDVIYLDTSLCLERFFCDISLSQVVLAELQARCARYSQTASPLPTGTSIVTGSESIASVTLTVPISAPATTGNTDTGGPLVTQTLVLSQGQIVTLGLTGTILTTLTASSALTTTWVATVPSSASAAGNNAASPSLCGYGLSLAVGTIGVMVGGALVL